MAEAETDPAGKGGAFTAFRRAVLHDKRVLWGLAALAALIGLWLIFGRGGGDAQPYRSAVIDRGAVTRVVSATGALEPLVKVDIGSTVSGPVLSVEVDFNSQVRAGQVLARLDPDSFQQRVREAEAQLASAQADANVARTEFERYARLDAAGFASPQLMAEQRAARDRAQAQVQQAAAALASARTDLARTIIRSPINGVVVDRQVNPGQSVAASFQAPTLFVIAQDLSRLQANITVDEADIGEVREGMQVRFMVDAFAEEEFQGTVAQVRQQGVDTNGVVSYTVVVEAENPGRKLLPGMTANAEIVVEERADVLRAPNAALRFRPADEALVARGQDLIAGAGERRGAGLEARASAPADRAQRRARAAPRIAIVWVLRANRPEPVRVELGVVDDSHTEIVGGDLKEGDAVITGGGPPRAGAPAGVERGPGGPQMRIRGA